MAYALAFVALERITSSSSCQWLGVLILSILIGFLGLVDETVALIVLALWGVVEVSRSLSSRPTQPTYSIAILKMAAGPVLGALLLAVGGGVLTGVLTGTGSDGALSLGWPLDPRDRGAVSSITPLAAGIGLLQIGTLIVSGAALLLDRGTRHFVLLLVAGSAAFLTAALVLRYEAAPYDIARFDGHARNFALLALMLALSVRLAALRPNYRYAVAAVIFLLVTWPTVAVPARKLGLAMGHGVQIANAGPESRKFDEFYRWMGRYALERFSSKPIAAWIREHTAPDARVLSPMPYAMTVATGRPNASGFADFVHLSPQTGTGYLDAIRLLEPAALARLKIKYVHAPDKWAIELPERAKGWLVSPTFFEPVLRHGSHTLYRVQPAFLELDAPPAPESFEALRRAVPADSAVYLSPANGSLNTVRAIAALPHVRLLGSPDKAVLHLQTNISSTPIGSQAADFVVTSAQLAPSMFRPDARAPIFWNQEISVYAPVDAIAAVREAPPRPFTVRLEDADTSDGRLAFTATFTNTSGEGWTGQDWLVVLADASPWNLPRIRPTDPPAQWYAGQASPRPGSITHRYEFDPQSVTLSLRNPQEDAMQLPSSGDGLKSGVWILGVRLRSEYQLSAFIPVVKVVVPQAGDVSYEVYQGELGVNPSPRPPEP